MLDLEDEPFFLGFGLPARKFSKEDPDPDVLDFLVLLDRSRVVPVV